MVKSVVKGMDFVVEFAKKEWNAEVTGFVVTGASKRGWTSWLTAATGDPRVKAIAPMVFDSLNLLKQMPHQVECFGDYSLMIRDYKERKLLPLPETEEAKQLWAMVDPWVYKDALTLPKLIVNGTNDPYWTQDALNLYWGDLKGPKAVVYVPNAGHDLRVMADPAATKEAMKKDFTPIKAIDTIAAFSRCVIQGKEFPKIEATYNVNGDGQGHIAATSSVRPKAVRHWSAESDTRDYRKSLWTASEPITPDEGNRVAVIAKVNKPHLVHLLEFEYALDGQSFFLSTPVQVVDRK
jgi:PhoPQ-activated pathogenicity-related protein